MTSSSPSRPRKSPPTRCCAREPAHPYVSRGGVKLAAALDHFRFDPMFDPRGRVCLDVGASTGGFTEVLLARGARRVYAVDVGRGQLHPKPARAAGDRVAWKRPTFAPSTRTRLPERPDFVAVDVSFISLKLVLPAALAARANAGAGAGADQAAVRSRPTSRQERHRARSARSRRGLRRHRGVRHLARLARRRHHPLAHPRRRRQSRVLHRGAPQLKPWRCAFLSATASVMVPRHDIAGNHHRRPHPQRRRSARFGAPRSSKRSSSPGRWR